MVEPMADKMAGRKAVDLAGCLVDWTVGSMAEYWVESRVLNLADKWV